MKMIARVKKKEILVMAWAAAKTKTEKEKKQDNHHPLIDRSMLLSPNSCYA